MYEDVPIVPNLYSAPSNPLKKDCYYNITLDKYYIYDGTQWLEAKNENDPTAVNYNALLVPRTGGADLDSIALLKFKEPNTTDVFELKYSTNNGLTFTTENYTDFDLLTTKTNSNDMENVTDIIINFIPARMETIVGKIYPKTIVNKNIVKKIDVNNYTATTEFCNGVLVLCPYGEIEYSLTTDYDGTPFFDGQEITMTITMKNIGNVDLTNITIGSELSGDEWALEIFVQGETKTFTGSYYITPTDVNVGYINWDWYWNAQYDGFNWAEEIISQSTIKQICSGQ